MPHSKRTHIEQTRKTDKVETKLAKQSLNSNTYLLIHSKIIINARNSDLETLNH